MKILANRDRRAKHDPEAVQPRPATLRALEDIAGCDSIADMVALEHGGSGPRYWDVTHFAQRGEIEVEQPDVVCTLGASPRIHLRRTALLAAMTVAFEPATSIRSRLSAEYRSRCPAGRVSTAVGEDLRMLRERGIVRKQGSARFATWALAVAPR